MIVKPAHVRRATARQPSPAARVKTGGRQGIRTPDPRVANAMLSQLS